MLVPLPPSTCNDLARSSVANDNMIVAVDRVIRDQFDSYYAATGKDPIPQPEADRIKDETTTALLQQCDPIVTAAVRDYLQRNPG